MDVLWMKWMRTETWLSWLQSDARREYFRASRLTFLILLLIIAVISARGLPTSRGRARTWPRLPTVTVRLGNKNLHLWVAANTRTRDRGLMYITKLPENRGMLFVFHQVMPEVFWMKHTLIPLDLIFLNSKGTIVRHYTMTPDDGKKLYPSVTPIRYAIELHAGAFTKLHLQSAMTVLIPALPKSGTTSQSGHS
jgi:uncharacterized membrane protein (UPF0127 family)